MVTDRGYRLPLALLAAGCLVLLSFAPQAKAACPEWMKHQLKALHSAETIDLCKLVGDKPTLIVNTASHCGFTYQFRGLEALYQKYREQGFVVLGFPSPSFDQEAKTEKETAEMCFKNYGVSFPMTSPVVVTGDDAHPVFQHLAEQVGPPGWNFNKFLVDSSGKVLKKYSAIVSPLSKSIVDEVDAVLN